MKKIKLLVIIAILTTSLAGCSNSKEEAKKEVSKPEQTQKTPKAEQTKTIETPVGMGELIPLKSGSGDVVKGQNYLKIVSKDKPNDSDIIKTCNELSKNNLKFNYFIIQYGDQGIHFIKNAAIGNVGEIDLDCAPLQPGSRLKEVTKYVSIEGDKIVEETVSK